MWYNNNIINQRDTDMNTIDVFKAKIAELVKGSPVVDGPQKSVCIDQDHVTRKVVVTCTGEDDGKITTLFTFSAGKLSQRRMNIIFNEVDFHLKQVMISR